MAWSNSLKKKTDEAIKRAAQEQAEKQAEKKSSFYSDFQQKQAETPKSSYTETPSVKKQQTSTPNVVSERSAPQYTAPVPERKRFVPSPAMGVTHRTRNNKFYGGTGGNLGVGKATRRELSKFFNSYNAVVRSNLDAKQKRATIQRMIGNHSDLFKRYENETGKKFDIAEVGGEYGDILRRADQEKRDKFFNKKLQEERSIIPQTGTFYGDYIRKNGEYDTISQRYAGMNGGKVDEFLQSVKPYSERPQIEYKGKETRRYTAGLVKYYTEGGQAIDLYIEPNQLKNENLLYMTSEERNIYAALLSERGEKEADDFLDRLSLTLNQRRAARMSINAADKANRHKILSGAAGIVGSFAKGLSLLEVIKQSYEQANSSYDTYRPFDPYNSSFDVLTQSRAIKEGITRDMSDAGKTITDFTLGLAENAARIPLGPAGLYVMGAGVAAETAVNQGVNGETNASNALLTGLAYGTVEVITEKISLDNLMKILRAPKDEAITGVKSILKTIAKNVPEQALYEASEEGLSNLADNIADRIINGDKSEYEQYVRELMRNGATEADARKAAFVDKYIIDTLKDAGAGAVSGAIFGAGGSAINGAAQVYNNTTTIGQELRDLGAAESVVNEGLARDAQTSANRYAQRLQNKQNKGRDLSDWNVGRQFQKNIQSDEGTDNFINAMAKFTPITERDTLTDTVNGEIRNLNGRTNADNTIETALDSNMSREANVKHEVLHWLRRNAPAAYTKLENTVIAAARETNSQAVDNRMEYLMNEYGYSEDVAREEIVAELTGGFNNRAIQRIAEGNSGLVNKITAGLREAKAQIRQAYAKGNYENAQGLQLTFEQLNNAEKQYLSALETARGAQAQTGDVRYSPIEYDNDGNAFVRIDEDILEGVSKNQYVATVKETMRNKYGSPIQTDSGEVNVNRTSRREYTASQYTQNINNATRVDKFRMANNLDEIIQNQQNTRFESPKHKRNDNIVGFERGDVNVRVGTNDYKADVVVGITTSGRKVFYDVVNLSPTTIKDAAPANTAVNTAIDIAETTPSTNSIPENDGNVKMFSVREGDGEADINESVNSDMTDAEKRNALEERARFVPRSDAQQMFKDAQKRSEEHFRAQQKIKPSEYSEDSWQSYGEEFGTENVQRDMQQRTEEAERRENSYYSDEDWGNLEEPVPEGYDWTKEAENWDKPKEKPKTSAELDAEADETVQTLMEERGVDSPDQLAEKTVSRADIRKAKRKYYTSPKGIHEIGTMAYTRMVDDMHPIWNYTDSFEKAMTRRTDENGKKVVKFTAIGKQNPYKMAMNAKDATSRSAYLITDYLTDFDANIIGKGLNDTIAESGITPENLETFNEYLVAKNAIYWLDEKRGGKYKKVYEDDRLNNWRVAKKIADAFENKHPEFKQAAENIYEWEKKMGQAWLVDTGVTTQEQWDYLWKMYPNYVPFYRAEMVNAGGDGAGMINVDNVFKKAVGSSQKILSPIENIMYNTASYVNHAYKHAVISPAVDMFDTLESDPENNVLREFMTEVVPADPAELVPTRFVEETRLTENDLRRSSVQQRFSDNVDKAFSGEITERTPITIGDTPTLYKKYGAGDNPLTITQSTMYKIAYPTGYFGAEETGHNLGIPALKQLPKQIAAPIAILKSNTQQDSLIALTEWEDANGNPVIIPLHLDKNGALGLTNEVASTYGKKDIEPLLTDKNGKSTVLYTKNNESIHQLLSSRLQLPAAASDDTLVKHNISNNEGNVNSENFVPDNRDLASATNELDEAGITRTLKQQTGVDYGVVSVMKDGQMRYFRVNDKEFLKAIDNTRKGREGWLATAAAITRARGALLTSLNPAFSLVTNTIKDAGTYLTNSTDVNKAKAIGAAVMGYADMAKNAYHQKKGDTYSNDFTQYKAMGGQYSNLHTAGTNQLKKAMNDTRGGKRNTAKKVATFIPRAYLTLGDAIESGPRTGQFKRTLKETGDIHEAFYQAKDVTVNFSRMGTWGRYINSFSNFFNAAIQGSDKLFRQAKNNPAAMATGMAALALVSAAAYGVSHLKRDDKYEEAWKDLSNYQKNNNWNFYRGNGKFVSIPKPRENASLITLGEAIIDKYMFGQDDRFKEFFSNYILSALPDGNIPFITSIIQIGMNEDYRGVPIVSNELQKEVPEKQYDDSTTYYAKWLGEKTGLSPKQIDHFLKNETGAIGRAGSLYLSPSGQKDKAAMYSFGLSNTFNKDAYYSTDMVNGFYTNKEDAEKQAYSYPGADNAYLDNRFYQAGNVMSIINQMVKDNANDKSFNQDWNMENNRWFKRAYTNYAAEYKDNPMGFSDEVYNEIKGLYNEDSSILRLPQIDGEIKANKQSYTFDDPYKVIQYQKDVNNAVDEAYRELLGTAEYQVMDNTDKVAALKKAKEDAVKEVKQFYVESNGKGVMQDRNNVGAEIKRPTQEEMEQAEADIAAAKAIQDKKTSVTDTYLQDIVDRYNPDTFNHDGKTLSEMSEIGDVKTAKIGNRTYDINEDTQKKVKASATEKFYESLEKFYSGEAKVEDVIGLTAKGDYRYVEHEIDGKKIKQSLSGGRYNADGTERFDDFTLEKIATKIKEKAIADAAEEYADEITGGGGTSGTASPTTEEGSSERKQVSYVPRSSSGRRSSGRSSGSGGGRSSGSSGGAGRGVTVNPAEMTRFFADDAQYGILGRSGSTQVASNRVTPRTIRPKRIQTVKPLKLI